MTRAKGRARFITGGQPPDPRLRDKLSRKEAKRARKLEAENAANEQRKKGNT